MRADPRDGLHGPGRQFVDHRRARLRLPPVDPEEALGALGQQDRQVPLLGDLGQRGAGRAGPAGAQAPQAVPQQAHGVEHIAEAPHRGAVHGPERVLAPDARRQREADEVLVQQQVAAHPALRLALLQELLEITDGSLARWLDVAGQTHRRPPLQIGAGTPHRAAPARALLEPAQQQQREQHDRGPGMASPRARTAPAFGQPGGEERVALVGQEPRHAALLQAGGAHELRVEEGSLRERAARHRRPCAEPLALASPLRHARLGSAWWVRVSQQDWIAPSGACQPVFESIF